MDIKIKLLIARVESLETQVSSMFKILTENSDRLCTTPKKPVPKKVIAKPVPKKKARPVPKKKARPVPKKVIARPVAKKPIHKPTSVSTPVLEKNIPAGPDDVLHPEKLELGKGKKKVKDTYTRAPSSVPKESLKIFVCPLYTDLSFIDLKIFLGINGGDMELLGNMEDEKYAIITLSRPKDVETALKRNGKVFQGRRMLVESSLESKRVDLYTRILFIGCIPEWKTRSDVNEWIRSNTGVSTRYVNKHTDRGYAHVGFHSASDAQKVLTEMDGIEWESYSVDIYLNVTTDPYRSYHGVHINRNERMFKNVHDVKEVMGSFGSICKVDYSRGGYIGYNIYFINHFSAAKCIEQSPLKKGDEEVEVCTVEQYVCED